MKNFYILIYSEEKNEQKNHKLTFSPKSNLYVQWTLEEMFNIINDQRNPSEECSELPFKNM